MRRVDVAGASRRFEGKSILITGAGSGFGRATALAFAREGAADLYLADIRQDRVEAVAGQVSALGASSHPMTVDIGKRAEVDQAFGLVRDRSGRLDVVVSNAALFGMPKNVLALDDSDWFTEVDTSLNGAYLVASRAARMMVDAAIRGSILFTASISAIAPSAGLAGYCSTKAAIVMLAKVMALELAPYGVRVNCVSPGPADTQRSVDYVGEEIMSRLRQGNPSIPLTRLASPEDVAELFVFLASEGASYITGQNVIVDGGLTLQYPWAPLE